MLASLFLAMFSGSMAAENLAGLWVTWESRSNSASSPVRLSPRTLPLLLSWATLSSISYFWNSVRPTEKILQGDFFKKKTYIIWKG